VENNCFYIVFAIVFAIILYRIYIACSPNCACAGSRNMCQDLLLDIRVQLCTHAACRLYKHETSQGHQASVTWVWSSYLYICICGRKSPVFMQCTIHCMGHDKNGNTLTLARWNSIAAKHICPAPIYMANDVHNCRLCVWESIARFTDHLNATTSCKVATAIHAIG